jgi:hypothetical protein
VLSSRSGSSARVHGVDIVNRPVAIDDTPAMRDRRAVLSNALGEEDQLPALLATSTEALVDALAVLVAETLDLTHGGVGPHASRSQALADTLAIALDLDMTQCWTPDLDFWMHLPKAMIVEALNNAPRIAALPAAERAAMATAFAKMKKSELAVAVAQTLEGSGWLPGILVTPDTGGEIALTEAGRAAVEAIAAGAIIAAE